MAISWGSWSSNNRLRCGIEMTMSPGTVTASTTNVNITTKVYLQTRYASNEFGTSNTWFITGDVSNSGNTDWNLGDMGYVLMGTDVQNFATSHTSSNQVDATGRIHSYYAYPGTEATVSSHIHIPIRPYYVPDEVTSVNGTRDSDSQATVTWVNHGTTDAPYSSYTIQMQTQTGGTWGSWVTVGSPAAYTTSFVKGGLSANHKYDFRVRANNSAGSSAYTEDPTDVYMTPGAPSGVSSSLDPSGTSITTSWSNTAYTSSTVTHEVQRSVNGGAFSNVQTGIAQGTLQWVDSSPGAGSNQYRVRSVTSEGSLGSAYTTGNTVSTIVAPNAPTNLSPNGVAADLGNENVVLTWTHNDGGDGAAQSHFTIETSDDNGANWDALATDIASSTSSYTITAGTLSNGVVYQWKVKTEGIVSAGYGPFSTAATVTGSARPTATIDTNLPPAALNTTPLVLAWDYNQDQSSPQAEWTAELYTGGQLLEVQSGTGTTAQISFAYPLVTATTYDVRVRVRSGAGLWSEWAEASTDFELLPPAVTYTVTDFQQCTGVMVLDLWAEEPEEGVTVAVESVTIERRVEGGVWVTIATGIEVPNTILDVIPLTNGQNEYRVTSVSASPSYRVNDIVTAYGTDGTNRSPGADGLWVLLSYGDDFSNVLRFHGNPRPAVRSDRTRAAQHFLGRAKPLLLMGENTDLALSVSGELHWDVRCLELDECKFDSPPWEWIAMSKEAETVCYRDYTGRRFFGMLGAVDAPDGPYPGFGSLSLSVTETDYDEPSRFGGYTSWVGGGSGGAGGDLTVTDHGDGTVTLDGTAVTDHGDGTFTVNSTAITDHGDGTYTAVS